MALLQVLFVIALGLSGQCQGFLLEGVNKEIDECLQMMSKRPQEAWNASFTVGEMSDPQLQSTCLQEYVWKFGGINWADFNVTQDEVNFINDLTKDLVGEHNRFKRTVGGPGGPGMGNGPMYPGRGFSIRREYRRLTDGERFHFHHCINKMKFSGKYDIFAKIHQGIVLAAAHGGPNFFGWHRIYLALFEQALRRISPNIALPYWDTTLDFEMDNPYNSIIWSDAFLGNGDGIVNRGPFAFHQTPYGPLMRNIGGGSRLVSKEDIMRLLTKCFMSEITHPNAKPGFNAEVIHGGPHIWVGGQMAGMNSAGFDPVFFMYHCFIDYVFEEFRVRQSQQCGINPETDYPNKVPGHEPWRPMAGFPQYRNIDGLRLYWTKYWYRYERSPYCNKFKPSCGSPYLYCNFARNRCVSRARRYAPGSGPRSGMMAFGNPDPQLATRAAAQVSRLSLGPLFDAPESDLRSNDRLLGKRKRRAAPIPDTQSQTAVDSNTANAPASGDVTHSFNVPMPLLPLPDISSIKKQDTKTIDTAPVVDTTVFVPVQIFVERPTSRDNCRIGSNGAMHVDIRARGMNYVGIHDEYAILDARHSISSAMVYMAVELPLNSSSEVLFEATDGCGRPCQARCIDKNAAERTFRDCDGIVTYSRESTFGLTRDGAVESIWRDNNAGVDTTQNDILLVCPTSRSQW